VLPFAPGNCFVSSPSFSTSELALQKDVVYGSAVNPYTGGFDKTEILKLDVLTPPAKDQRKLRPAMVWIHGGSFLSGDKGDDRELREALAARGYVVFSINYRKVDDGIIPAIWALLSIEPAVVAAQDARAAVRFVRKHASEWRVDPDRIVIGGESAGALTSNLYGFAKGTTDGASGNAGYDSAINGVLSVSGSMRDLAFCATVGGPPKYQPLLCVISSPPGKDLTNELSKGDVPVVDLHGTKDTTIPYMAGREMITRAGSVGVTSLLLTIPGAGHVPMGNIMDPKEPYLLQWLNFTSGALNLASAECPHSSNHVIAI
jgi:poly(3-hydroxybutyrate) depolymerase